MGSLEENEYLRLLSWLSEKSTLAGVQLIRNVENKIKYIPARMSFILNASAKLVINEVFLKV